MQNGRAFIYEIFSPYNLLTARAFLAPFLFFGVRTINKPIYKFQSVFLKFVR